MKRISNDSIYSELRLVDMGISANINIEYLIPGVFVKCIYDNLIYIGMILEKSEEDHDVRVKFMKERNDV